MTAIPEGEEMKKIICPICWHEETLLSIKENREPCRDDSDTMTAHLGKNLGDINYWSCSICSNQIRPSAASILIDAVLRVSDPDSDSFDGETFEDAINALFIQE